VEQVEQFILCIKINNKGVNLIMSDKLQIFIAMSCYMLVVIGIGVYYSKRASESSDNYLIGGRSLGPWVVAMGAEASDMSGWLLMGLPGVAYFCNRACCRNLLKLVIRSKKN
jgi:uncharacterized sodium:solute symporter family permease YidK